jgi:hypothetical protein
MRTNIFVLLFTENFLIIFVNLWMSTRNKLWGGNRGIKDYIQFNSLELALVVVDPISDPDHKNLT